MAKILYVDLNQVTEKYSNRQEDWLFINNAIKSAIVDAKLDGGADAEIKLVERLSDNPAFDLAINGAARKILEQWEV